MEKTKLKGQEHKPELWPINWVGLTDSPMFAKASIMSLNVNNYHKKIYIYTHTHRIEEKIILQTCNKRNLN